MHDVLVLGGGAIGLGIAAELARRGARVTLFERDQAGRGASWAAGGMLAPFTEDLPEGELLTSALQSLDRYPAYANEIQQASGVNIRHVSGGILDVAFDETQLQKLRERVARVTQAGRSARLLSPSDIYAIEPAVAADALGGAMCAAEGQVDNRRLVRALRETARVRGVEIHENTLVEALETSPRRVLGVRTRHGFFAAPHVVNTLGAWADTLRGVPENMRVPVRPLKGQMLALAMPEGYCKRVVWGAGMYAVPRSDGRLVIGATVEDVGFDARITAGGIHFLLDRALRVFPGAAAFALSETWCGFRPAAADMSPIVGATELAGYYLAVGHHRNGHLIYARHRGCYRYLDLRAGEIRNGREKRRMPSVTVTINGVAQDVEADRPIGEILQTIGIAPEGTAVAVNDHVIPRSDHAAKRLAAGDRVEIVHAVAGG